MQLHNFSLSTFLFLCADSHCSSSFLLPVINRFWYFAISFIYIKFILGQTNFFLFSFLLYIFSSFFLLALNCDVVACVTSIFCIANISSLLSRTLVNSSASFEAVNFNISFCADLHCSTGFIYQMINWFCSFEKYNIGNKTRKIQLRKYNTEKYSTKNTTQIIQKE